MIAYVKGIIARKDGYGVILEANGIGYEMSMSSKALGTLPAVGNTAQVWTYLHVKDDGMSLFGFCDAAEKEMFAKLIGVSGIGPKVAISALSTFNPKELASAIAAGDVTRISSVPGIGKKTAQRVVLELQGILKSEADQFGTAGESAKSGAMADASAALESMGFTSPEIAAALKGCTSEDVSAIMRYALKQLGGRA